MPFLEILTRHHTGRPKMLAVNQASIQAQTDDDWVQTLIIDDYELGVEWANWTLGKYADRLEGEYIWVLDDDDECIRDTLVAELKAIVGKHDPDVIMVRGDCGKHGILPEDEFWGQRPKATHVCMSGFVVRREVWQRFGPGAFTPELMADFRMARDLFVGGCSVVWHDVVAMKCQRAGSRGREE